MGNQTTRDIYIRAVFDVDQQKVNATFNTMKLLRQHIEDLSKSFGEHADPKLMIKAIDEAIRQQERYLKGWEKTYAEVMKAAEEQAEAQQKLTAQQLETDIEAYMERLDGIRAYNQAVVKLRQNQTQTDTEATNLEVETSFNSYQERLENIRSYNQAVVRLRQNQTQTDVNAANIEREAAFSEYNSRLQQVKTFNQASIRLRQAQQQADQNAATQETEAAATEYTTRLGQIKSYNQAVGRLRRAEEEQAANAAAGRRQQGMDMLGGFGGTIAAGPLGGIMSGMVNMPTAMGIAAGSAIHGAYDKGVEAREWSYSIKQLGEFMGEANAKAIGLDGTVRNLAISMGTDIPDAAAAMREAISMAVSPEQAENFVRMAQALGMITGHDTKTETHVLAGIKNAFDMNSGEFRNVPAKLAAMKERANVNIEPGQLGGLDVLAQESGAQFDDMLAAMGTMSLKDVKPDRAIAAMRQVLTKAMFPTNKQKSAQGEAGFEFTAANIQKFGWIESIQRLDAALKKTGVSLREALGVESNRGTIVAIEALLDKTTTAQMQAAVAGANNRILSKSALALKGTDQYQSEMRGEAWSQYGGKIGSPFASFGAGLSSLLLSAVSPGYRAAQRDLRDEAFTSVGVDALARATGKRPASENILAGVRVTSPEEEQEARAAKAHTEWKELLKTLKKVEGEYTRLGAADISQLTNAQQRAAGQAERWAIYVGKLTDTIAVHDEKLADKIANRGSDYSTRSKTGNILSTHFQARQALGALGSAESSGDLGRMGKESGRLEGFLTKMRGMDLLSVGKHGFSGGELDTFLEQQLEAEGVTGTLERSRRRRELMGEARQFEGSVRRGYNKFSSRPDIHKDADFTKDFIDTVQTKELKSEMKAEKEIIEQAKGFQSAAQTAAESFTKELERQKELTGDIAVNFGKIHSEVAAIADPEERMRQANALMAKVTQAHSQQTGGKAFAATAEDLKGPGSFPVMFTPPVSAASHGGPMEVNLKVTLAPGTSDEQAEQIAKKLGMHLRTELDRGRFVLDNNK